MTSSFPGTIGILDRLKTPPPNPPPLQFSSAFNFSERYSVLQNATVKGCRGHRDSRSIIWVAFYNLSFEDSICVDLKE